MRHRGPWEGARGSRCGHPPVFEGTHLFLKALLTMALSTRRSPTCDGPRKWNISMARSVGWAWHSRLRGGRYPMGPVPQNPKRPFPAWSAPGDLHVP